MKLNIKLFANDNIDWAGIMAGKYTRYNGSSTTVKINGQEFLIQIPSGGVNSETSIYVAGRGGDSIGDSYAQMNAARNSNTIVIAPVHLNRNNAMASYDFAEIISDHFNLDNPDITFCGHSASGTIVLDAAQRYITQTGNPTTVVLCDPTGLNSDDSHINYSNFKDSVLLTYCPTGGGATFNNGYTSRLQKAAAAGAKVIVVRYNGDHAMSDNIAAQMGAYDVANLDLPPGYKYQWMDASGKLHDFKSNEEAQAYLDEALIQITGDLYSKCSDLSKFASKYNGKDGTLASDLSFVSNGVSKIVSDIKTVDSYNYTPSANEMPAVSAMYGLADYYNGINTKVYNNLQAEAQAIYDIANAIYQMDEVASIIGQTSLEDGDKLFSASNSAISSKIDALKSTSDQLVSNALDLSNLSGYSNLKEVLGGTGTQMSRSAINDAVTKMLPDLQSSVDTATALKNDAAAFMDGIGASNILQGEAWDAVKTNLETYSNLLDVSIEASTFIQDVLGNALTQFVQFFDAAQKQNVSAGAYYGDIVGLLNAIDDSESIDTSLLGDLETALTSLQADITDLSAKIEAGCPAVPKYRCTASDEKGNCTASEEYYDPYTPSQCSEFEEHLALAQAVSGAVSYQIGRINDFVAISDNVNNMLSDALDTVKSVYDNPADLVEGNQDFGKLFELDFSKYGIDSKDDYKQVLQDYYDKINPTTAETPAVGDVTDPTGATDDEPYYGSGNPGGGGGGGGDTGGTVPQPTYTLPTTTNLTYTLPSPTYTMPTLTVPTTTVTPTNPDDSDDRSDAEAEARRRATITPTPSTSTDDDEEARRRAAEEAARRAQRTDSTSSVGGDGATVTSSDGVTRLGTDSRPYTNSRPSYPTSFDDSIEDSVLTDPVIDGLTPDTVTDYSEPIINEPLNAEIIPDEQPVIPEKKENKALKTMGIAAGIGMAAGAAALGAHVLMKDKEDEESDEEYGYDK